MDIEDIKKGIQREKKNIKGHEIICPVKEYPISDIMSEELGISNL
ncbi:MAG: hypothetical protein ACP5OJ_02550 [Methanothermobacter sp.]